METIKTTSKQKNILFVDNDDGLVQEIKDYLNHIKAKDKLGLDVVFANNVNKGLKKMSEQKIDLIVIEILLPVVNGYYLAKKAVKENIPVIIYTQLKESNDISKMAETGVDNIFIKELIKPKDLIDKIRNENSLKIDLDKNIPELMNQIRTESGSEIQSIIKMVQCPRCGSVQAPNSHFCNNCGQKIIIQTKVIKVKSGKGENIDKKEDAKK